MFLHSGASLHGHEYSPTNSHIAQRNPLVRSSFSAPVQRLATYDNTNPTTSRSARRPLVKLRPESERFSDTEQEGDAMSEDGASYTSEASETTAGSTGKRRRRATRSRTLYQLAHPAPTLTRQQKLLHIRPKLLLQLQRLSPEKRPLPSVDVLPSTVVVPRLMKRFPRMFKGKGKLGANDVIIVRSEDYDTPDDDNASDTTEDESLEHREVLAVICQIRGIHGSAEICLSDGSVWYGTALPKGVFEFITTDAITGEKTTARWVQRIVPRRHSSQPTSPVSTSDASCDHKYLFSILQPNSRRHPILASITKKVLDIPDSYTNISSSAGRHPPTSPIRASELGGRLVNEKDNLERSTIAVDDNLRALIQVTGIWVALRQGWCPYFKYDDVPTSSPGRPTSMSLPRGGNGSKVNTHGNDKGSNLDTRASTPESNQSSLGTAGGKGLRSSNHIFRSSPSGRSTSPKPAVQLPRRAVSTGAVFMQRAAARRVGHPPSTVASDSEGEMISVLPIHVTPEAIIVRSTDQSPLPSPQPQVIPSAAVVPPDNTTMPFHRRVQSAVMLSNPMEKPEPHGAHGQTNGHGPSVVQSSAKPSKDVSQPKNKKAGRWRSFIKFLRHNAEPEH